jgi:DNA-binding MarR family transcriptional regulator
VSPSAAAERRVPEGYAERLSLLVHRLAAQLLERADGNADFELTAREYTALALLARDKPGSQHELGRLMGLAPQLVVALTDALEDRGLVARRTNPLDRRRTLVELTQQGRSVLGRADKLAAEIEDDVLGTLTPNERERLHEMLRRALSP